MPPATEQALAGVLDAARRAQTDPTGAERLVAAALARASRDPEVRSASARALGLVAATRGDLVAATRHLRAAARLADRSGLVDRSCEARGTLAYVLLLTTGSQAALRELERAAATRPTGLTAARLLMQRGLVLQELHRLDEAEASHGEAILTLHALGADPLLEGDIRTNRAIVRVGRADWRGARADLDAAGALYLATGHPGRTAMVEHNRGALEALRGDLPAALVAFDAAAILYRDAGLDPGLLSVERADVLLTAGLARESLVAAAEAVAQFSGNGNRVDLVQARLTLAEAALLAGDGEVAGREADLARTEARRQRRPRWAALAGHLGVRARAGTGDDSPALLTAARRSATELETAGWPVQAADARLVAVLIALQLGRPADARAELARIGSRGPDAPAELRARACHADALVRRASGDGAGAARSVRAGLAVLEQLQAGLGASDLRAESATHAVDLARLGIELALESGGARRMLAAVERSRATGMRFRSARPPDDEALVADLAALREVVAEIGASGADVAPGLLRRRTALESAVRDRARHAAGRGGGVGGAGSARALAETFDALGDRTLVEYADVDGELHAVRVASGRCSLHRLGPTTEVDAAAARLRSGLQWLASGRGTDAVVRLVRAGAGRLDELLLAPLGVADGVPLVLVPTGALSSLPWSILPTCADRPVSVAPSAALWTRAATAPPGGDGVLLAHGPGLEHAAAEIRAIARVRPDAVRLTGRRARVGDVLAAMDGAATAHLATHGTFRADNPMFSQLHLADGPLVVYDLERLADPPRQMVLASCDSARAHVVGPDELVGLAAALLSLGTQALVAATMPVPDRTSRTLMVRLHRHLAAGWSMAEALARARTDVLRDGDPAAVVTAAGYQCLGAG